MKIIVFHIYKGGTGESLIALNVTARLAQIDYKVCLLDFDFLSSIAFSVFLNIKNILLKQFLVKKR